MTNPNNESTLHLLQEQGYVKLNHVFSNEEMDDLRLKSEAVLFRTNSQHRDRFKSTGSMCNLMELPEFAALLSDPRILQALTQTGGKDIRWTSGFLISKPPGGAPLFWHQDWWGWDSPVSYQPQPAQLFVMIYLTDTVLKMVVYESYPALTDSNTLFIFCRLHTRKISQHRSMKTAQPTRHIPTRLQCQ